MPPQQNSGAVIDDEYGLEPAKPATAPSTDEYGLEVAKPAAAPHEPNQKPEMSGGTEHQAEMIRSGKLTDKFSKPTKFETEQGKIPENYGFTFSNFVPAIGRGIKNVANFGKELYTDLNNPDKPLLSGESETEGPKESIAHKYLFRPAEEQSKEAQRGDISPLESIGHSVAAGIPLIGPWVAGHAQQAGTGDIGGAAGETIGEIAAGKALHPETLAKGVEFTKPVVDKVVRGTPITEAGKIEAAKNQALTVKKPTMNETEYAQQVTDALPELQKIAQDNKGKIKTPRQAVQAINDRISQIEAPIADHIAGQTAEHQLIQPHEYQDAINSAMDRELAKRPGVYKPEEIEKAKKAVNDFIGEDPKTLTEIEGNRRRLNQDADAYHKADTAGKRAIDVSDATATAQRAAANAIRDVLYGDGNTPGKLEKAGVTATDANGNPMSLRDVRRQVGRLLNIRDHFEDAITKAEATGDWKAFKPMFTGPSIAAGGLGVATGGLLGGPFGSVLGLLAGEGVKAWADYLRTKNPNLNTEKMFRNLANTSAPTNVPQIKTMTPPAPPPVAVQQTLGLPTAAHGPLFNIEQTPRLRPDVEEPRLGTISGQQVPLNIPASPEQAPLFSIPQTPGVVPEQPKLSNVPKFEKATAPIEAETSGLPKVKTNFRGTAENVRPASEFNAETPKAPVQTPLKAKLPNPQPAKLNPGETTFDRFYDKAKDEWSPEREANHAAIAEAATAGKTPPTGRPPQATITLGGTGAGKTTVTRGILGNDPNLVNVDSDANKLLVPEYEGLKTSDPQKAAARVHDESKAISKRIIQEAIKKGLDFVYDTSTGGGGEGLFKRLKDLGYDVKLVFADVPTEEAVKRAELRARESTDPTNKGRIVPEEVIRNKHAEAAKAFLKYQNSPHVDEIRAFDTTSRTPEEFYSRSKAGEKIANQKVMDRIREKAGEEVGQKKNLLSDESGQPLTVYHGSPEKISKFEVGRKGERTVGGFIPISTESQAIFFTPEKSKAWNWAQNRGGKPGFVHSANIELKKPLDLRGDDIEWLGGPEDDSLIEYWRDKDPVLSKWSDLEWEDHGIDASNLKVINREQLHSLLDNKKVVESLKRLGYDGAILDEGKHGEYGGTSYAVFDPKQIHSIEETKGMSHAKR